MVSKIAVDRALAYYVAIALLLSVNIRYIDSLWLKIINLVVMLIFVWLYYSLHKAWAKLKYTTDNDDAT
jgi:hypothetical protein